MWVARHLQTTPAQTERGHWMAGNISSQGIFIKTKQLYNLSIQGVRTCYHAWVIGDICVNVACHNGNMSPQGSGSKIATLVTDEKVPPINSEDLWRINHSRRGIHAALKYNKL